MTTQNNVSVVVLRRPPVNAMDLDMVSDLIEGFSNLVGHTNPPPLVITGSEGAFSAGVDYKSYRSYAEPKRSKMFEMIDKMASQLFRYPAATVAAINGHAIGGGLVLALACDFRIASQGDYKLALGEVQAGIPFPEIPLRIIYRTLPPTLRYQLALGAESMNVATACSAGVVSKAEDSSRLIEEAVTVAARVDNQPGYRTIKGQLVDLATDDWHGFKGESDANAPRTNVDVASD